MGLPGQTGRTLESVVRVLGSHGRVLVFVCLIFIWLCQALVVACRRFSCGSQTQLWHVGSSSPTRDRTQAPCIGSSEA